MIQTSENHESTKAIPGDDILQVALADPCLGSSLEIRRLLSGLKECRISICTNKEELSSLIQELGPDLIIFSHRFLEEEDHQTLSEIHHQNPSTYLIIQMPKEYENLKPIFLMGGASECVVVEEDDFEPLAGIIKKALIHISEKRFVDPSGTPVEGPLSEIVFSLDLDGRFTYINPDVVLLLGFDAEDLLGISFLDLISLAEPKARFQTYLQNASQNIMFGSDLPLRTSLGIEEEFSVRCVLVEGEILQGTAKRVSLCVEEADWKEACEKEGKYLQSSDPLQPIDGNSNLIGEQKEREMSYSRAFAPEPLRAFKSQAKPVIPSGSNNCTPKRTGTMMCRSKKPEAFHKKEKPALKQDSKDNITSEKIHTPSGEHRDLHEKPLKELSDPEQEKVAKEFTHCAIEEYRNGNYWKAVQFCKQAMEYRQDYRLYHLMGKAFATHPGFARDAMNAYKKALELKPSNLEVQKEIADLHMKMGHFTLALVIYRKILEKEPKDRHCRSRIQEIESRHSLWNTLGRTISNLFRSQKNSITH